MPTSPSLVPFHLPAKDWAVENGMVRNWKLSKKQKGRIRDNISLVVLGNWKIKRFWEIADRQSSVVNAVNRDSSVVSTCGPWSQCNTTTFLVNIFFIYRLVEENISLWVGWKHPGEEFHFQWVNAYAYIWAYYDRYPIQYKRPHPRRGPELSNGRRQSLVWLSRYAAISISQ